MDESKTNVSAPMPGDFELGVVLGGRKAFASVAGRCSSAEAACIRRIRNERLYQPRAANWGEFCQQYLGLSKTHANRLIRYLDEFGPDYFELVQLTRITPEQFRVIAPAIRDRSIHVDGQPIALIPENAERVAEAVAELRRAATPAQPVVPAPERLSTLDRRFDQLVEDFRGLLSSDLSAEERSEASSMLRLARLTIQGLEMENRS